MTTAVQPRRTRPERGRGRRGSRALGVLGELLLTAGVLLGLFVVWQVWWTDVEAGQEQATAVAAITERFEPPAADQPATLRTDDPPAPAPPAEGEQFAILHVPRWGLDQPIPIAEGVGTDVLNSGAAGHYPGTALPGAVGNAALAAHRQSYGAAFRHVDALQEGDPLVVESAEAWLVYRVTGHEIVTPDRSDVIAPVPGAPGEAPTQRLLTLTTCHPLWSTAERWIVHAALDGWVPRAEGVPAEMEAS
ncbi:class E sortase [Georgenia sp. TF02-10]|uniref:class E sortase n=1 Tax=Georgenia sp. TF02-10 TaxID=2917725 RepID=UPI001FA7DF4F|nr:class E sortase [Georgenia sp. TF02-10]UNX54907.1 class E sortase [Georgenia sp. TF02-10]